MKNKKWLSALGEADEKYIAEADPAASFKRHPWQKWQKLTLIAAGFLLIFTLLNVYLFAPIRHKTPDVSRYADSEYYGVIQKINAFQDRKPEYKNNFEKLMVKVNRLFGGAKAEDGNGSDFLAGDRDMTSDFSQEITDHQTVGVTEGDRIKRNDRYIYYLDETVLCVYTVLGEDSEQIAQFDFKTIPELTDVSWYWENWEMYLSSDGNTVTVIAPHHSAATKSTEVALISLDVTDPYAIAVKEKIFVDGSYISSRILANGDLLLMTRYYVGNVDFNDPSTFVPGVEQNGKETAISGADIIYPEELSGVYYTVLLTFDVLSHTPKDSMAFLSYSEQVYVSAEHIFTMRAYQEQSQSGSLVTSKNMTDISVVSYLGEKLSFEGSISVEGSVKDRYSLDEYEGVLRVVTTTDTTVYEKRGGENRQSDTVSIGTFGSASRNASLYLFRLSDREKIAEVVSFAPPGESVQSVRFDKNAAYVCTSVVLSDPVFFFDLSDPSAITYKDTGTIDGYSSSLVSLGDGFLLGIGYGSDFSTLKCEIYRETETGVISVAKYEKKNCSFSEDYKSYYIDRVNGLLGLGVLEHGYSGRGDGYLLLHFDGYNLKEIDFLKVYGMEHLRRGCYVNGYFYAFGNHSFAVHKIFD